MTMIVTETFNIFNDGRRHNPAPQSFQLSALQQTLRSSETKERIRLKEAIGFFGHRPRELSGKIDPGEMEVVQVDGKAVVLQIEPVVRTLEVDVDDAGNVTHTQEFLPTEMGSKCYELYNAHHGGFSWAMSGNNPGTGPAIARSFKGFDYVRQPNFIPLHRQQMLLSSVQGGDMLLSSMSRIFGDASQQLLSSFSRGDNQDAEAYSEMLLSAMMQEQQLVRSNLETMLDKLPFFVTADQRQAMLSMKTPDDVQVVVQLLSSMHKTDLSALPGEHKAPVIKSGTQHAGKPDELVELVAPRYSNFGQRSSI